MLSLFQMFSFKSMLNTLPSIGSRASSIIRIGECKNFPTFAELHTSPGVEASNAGSIWRLPRYTGKPAAAWPNYIEHYTHRRLPTQKTFINSQLNAFFVDIELDKSGTHGVFRSRQR